MKKKFIKLVSIVLTMLMLVGTMTALVSITAGAEEGEPIYLEKNKTATINGITYRFDTTNADEEESWARVNPDGTWEMNIRHGDMLWFPDVKLTDTSSVYAEVTNSQSAPNNYFTGLAYGVTGDAAYNSTNVAVLKTFQNDKLRLRVTGALRSSLTKINNGDYGNGGDTRAIDANFTTNAAWDAIKGVNGNWGGGKTVYFKVDQTADKVITEFGVPGIGAFTDSANTSYAKNLEGMYAIAGGSVGYTFVWGSDNHTQVRIDKLDVTNCTVAGVAQESYVIGKTTTDETPDTPEAPEEVLEPVYLEKNKTAVAPNGIVYRFDVANPDDDTVWARLNPDGSWEFSIRNGDMLWFPGIETSADSVIYAEVTNTMSGPSNLSSGFVYGVKSEGGTYTTGISPVMRTGKRIRVTPISSTGLFGYNGSDGYGNGGDQPRMLDNKYLTENEAYNAIKHPVNGNWNGGATVYFEISSADGNVNVNMGAPGKGAFYTGSYSLASNPKGAYEGGSVGYVVSYQGSEDTLSQFRINDIQITNCKVNGEAKDTYSLKVKLDPDMIHKHTPGEAATCTTPQICTECQQVIVAALGHTVGEAATCTTAQICTVCNAEVVAALGHTPGAAATCTTAQVCTVCNVELKAALGHTPGAEVTCTTSQTCTVCNAVIVAAKGHTPGAEVTCTTAQTCTVCNTELIPALGHTPGEAATCTTAQKCTVCDAEIAAALGHTAEKIPAVEPTTKTDGATEGEKCSVCGEITKAPEVIEKKSNAWVWIVIVCSVVVIGGAVAYFFVPKKKKAD